MSPIIIINRHTQMPSLVVGAAGGGGGVDVLAVPRLRGRPRSDRLGRIDQYRDLVDAAVRSPGDALHDKRDRLARVRGRLRYRCGRRRARRAP